MFKYFLITICIFPSLLGVIAAKSHERVHGRRVLRIGWVLYALIWFFLLYYLRYRWV